MEDRKIYDGVWWIPGKEEEKTHGTLRISTEGEGAILDLVSSIEDGNRAGEIYGLIFGFSTNERLISLQNCLVNTAASRFSEAKPQKLTAENVFIREVFYGEGVVHCDPSQKFEKVVVQFSYLNDWIGLPEFELEIGTGDGNRRFFTLKHDSPEEMEFPLNFFGIKGALRTCFGFGQNGYLYGNGRRVFAEQFLESGLVVQVEKAISIDLWIKKILNPLREFFVLATLKPNWISGASIVQIDQKGRKRNTQIFSRIFSDKRLNRKLYEHEMLFGFNGIKDRFPEVLQAWFQFKDEFGIVPSVFLSTIQSDHMYVEHRFLSLVQVMEGYHRVKEKKKSRRYFRERIGEILDSLPYGFLPAIIEDKEDFLNTVRSTRNYYTHLHEPDKKWLADERELLIINRQLSTIILVLILEYLGISHQKVFSNIQDKFRFFKK